jgi:hypothetical protein
MQTDSEWVQQYIRAHSTSSLGGGGFRWRNALLLSDADLEEVKQLVIANAELGEQYPTRYIGNRLRTGQRARSDGLTSFSPQMEYEGEVDRSRVIIFSNCFSLTSVFIKDKASWYTDIMDGVVDVIKPNGVYMYPFSEGGGIYNILSDLFKDDGQNFHASDGITWDAGAAIMLGKYFNWEMAPIGPTTQLPSGHSKTSLFGTIAQVSATRHLNGTSIVLSDDHNYFGSDFRRPKVLDPAPEDEQERYCLGLTFRYDSQRPRVAGIKITQDRADKLKSIRCPDYEEKTDVMESSHSLSEIAAHACMYFGVFGDRSLLESITNVKPSRYTYPRDVLEKMMLEETKLSVSIEIARQLGVEL